MSEEDSVKITHNKVGTNLNTSDSGRTNATDKAQQTKGASVAAEALQAKASPKGELASKVDLSPRAQEMKKIKDLAMAAPDIDEDKVAKFQKMIDEGTYKVSSKDIADKMVDEELSWM